MKKIVLATAALLVVSGAAFASESGHTGEVGNSQPAVVDTTRTSSIHTDSAVYKLLNSSNDVHKSAPQGSDRNLFGR